MARCLHGYEQGECLICQVLGDPEGAGDASGRREADGGRRRRTAAGGGRTTTTEPGATGTHLRWPGRRPAPAPVPVPPPAPPARRRHHPLATAALVLVVVLAVLVATWVLAGAFFAALRILELVGVAVAAGWVGYRAGHWRGRHER